MTITIIQHKNVIMSRDLVVYVKTSNTFEEVLQRLGNLLGVTFIPQYHQPWPTACYSGL
ncbi:hypothetical protein [Aphanothece hegewaldii]|uniref:hypothetical protein n=1 Tax=Aphanothece hegewaldii TaxID=1521625 RepID=UPI0015E75E0F|nr:hypothetical protein [Aphanothece hegewaldii]